MTATAALIACGIDGRKAMTEGFQRNALYVIFLWCFIHYKGNIWRNVRLVQKVSSFFGREINQGGKHDKVL